MAQSKNPFASLLENVTVCGREYNFFNARKLAKDKWDRLPFSIRALLENAVRNCDDTYITQNDVMTILNWKKNQSLEMEIPFKAARLILQDSTGVPVLVDLAAMRDAINLQGGDVEKINPLCPVELVVDHSVTVDFHKCLNAREKNEALEFERNTERFQFMKWGSQAFKNVKIVPPGKGILHQINLEHFRRVVFNENGILFLDSMVGTDSHTPLIGSLGTIGWGVGGIEAEAVMLGEPISMLLPEVVGCKLTGELNQWVTITDLALTITKILRLHNVVGKFVEFFGPGVTNLNIPDRATLSSMCPEFGATVAIFPADELTLDYLKLTGCSPETLSCIESYLKAAKLFQSYDSDTRNIAFSKVIKIDMSDIVISVGGPRKPYELVSVAEMKETFHHSLCSNGLKGDPVTFAYGGREWTIGHGSVVLASITSCTNSANPTLLIGAGLMARKAVEKGLAVHPYIKTSLSPGSLVITLCLQQLGLLEPLEHLGFHIVGYGSMTGIGNSGPLPKQLADAIERARVVTVGILSGNRNFEGRINLHVKANYLASPLLCIAYAIAGTVNIDLETMPIGKNMLQKDVFMKDIWPTRNEIEEMEKQVLYPKLFTMVYSDITNGNSLWRNLKTPESILFPWKRSSAYIRKPPFLDQKEKRPDIIENATVLLNLGDEITTDHISPGGSIPMDSTAGKYLTSLGVTPDKFNCYCCRRGNHEVVSRGTFSSPCLFNKMVGFTAPKAIHLPTKETLDIYDAAERYRKDGKTLIILAGKNYGLGSSRDWASKGPWMLGVRAVVAESYERIHRSNLVGMGILPLQYLEGQCASSLGLTGFEAYSITVPTQLNPGQLLDMKVDSGKLFTVRVRIDTLAEVNYFKCGGVMKLMLQKSIT